MKGIPITMYQYEICPFCNKLKAVLDYCNVEYSTIDVNPLTKKQFEFTSKLPEGHPGFKYRKVPIAQIGEEVVPDSPIILQHLLELLAKDKSERARAVAASAKDEKVKEWVVWADKELAVLLFPNLTRTFEESYQAFGYVNDVPGFNMMDKVANQWIGATAMWLAQGKIKKKYNISDEREALATCIHKWVAALEQKDFMGGSAPNLADLAVFGVLRAAEGFETSHHLLLQSEVGPWYTRMAAAVGERSISRVARE